MRHAHATMRMAPLAVSRLRLRPGSQHAGTHAHARAPRRAGPGGRWPRDGRRADGPTRIFSLSTCYVHSTTVYRSVVHAIVSTRISTQGAWARFALALYRHVHGTSIAHAASSCLRAGGALRSRSTHPMCVCRASQEHPVRLTAHAALVSRASIVRPAAVRLTPREAALPAVAAQRRAVSSESA